MDRFLTRTPQPSRRETSTIPSVSCLTKRKRLELCDDDIIHDLDKRKPIDSYDPSIRDEVRRAYLLKGPCQPKNHKFRHKMISNKLRSFQVGWFDDFHWLEYSISKDAAYCLCCYLFKKLNGSQAGGDVFVSKGFENWKKGRERLVEHVGTTNSSHNEARRMCENLQNQRQSVAYLISKQDLASQNSYRIRLNVSLWAARYLLGQGLAFRAHDVSRPKI